MIARLRAACAMLLWLAWMLTAGGLALHRLLLASQMAGLERFARRRRVAEWHACGLAQWLWLVRRVGGVRVTYVLHESCAGAKGPFLIVANHFGAFDGAVVYGAMRLFGQHDLRPIVAAFAKKVPVFRTAWRVLRAAFLRRDHGGGDLRSVRECAAVANADGANVIIFPAGRIVSSGNATDGGRTLLPPKPGGVVELSAHMPDHAVLSLTLWYRDWQPWRMSNAGMAPPGSDLVVEVRVLPPFGADAKAATAALRAEWERKAAWLRDAT